MTRTYVGRRAKGGRWVEVVAAGEAKPLINRDRPLDAFGWGGQAAGSVSLARSILSDLLGVETADGVAVMFAGDVLSHLPDDRFALGEAEVRRWLERCGRPRMSADELVEHLGSIALADPDEEAEALRGLVDRCWSAQSLTN